MTRPGPVLSIVIPALNEEEAIASTVERCLAAREKIAADSPVADVEVIVVSDGSTDRTEEIARRYPAVTVLGFDRNRGYGAAIKSGFAAARGEWVGFLDADGTCDPAFFATLCRALDAKGADVALGSRMGPGSQMPLVRTIGNSVFALLLGVLSRQRIGDTASGMRVLRKAILPDLDPMPDGLHYTPAMTARVLLEGKLVLVEEPMPYAERIGKSKLSVARDGVRFLVSIVRAAAIYRPARPLLFAALFGLAALGLGSGPSLYWLRNRFLEEWMTYRILAALLLGTATAILASAAVVAEQIASIAHGREAARGGVTGFMSRAFGRRVALAASALCFALAVAVSWPGVVEYATTAHVTMHWSRVVLSSLLSLVALTLVVTLFLTETIDLIRAQRSTREALPAPDRIRIGARDARGIDGGPAPG
jgi:glycosyltransferase involved in cell wall biosynthesis